MKRETLAVAVVSLLVLVTLLGGLLLSNRGGEETGGGEETPREVLEFLENVRLTDVPQSNNEPHIAVNPTDPNNIVAAGNDYGTPLEDAWVGYYTTTDGGKNWTRGLIPGYYDPGNPKPGEPLWGFKGTGDPVVAFDSKGTCYIAGIAFKRYPLTPGRSSGIFVARSDDKGHTFQVSMVVSSATAGTFHDKEWLAVDPNNGNVYVTWTAFNFYSASSLMFSKSTDGGRTWSTPKVISDLLEMELQVQGSAVVVDGNGTIHVVWIDFATNTVRYASSSDEGETWTQPRSIAPVTPIPSSLQGGDYRTPTLMALGVDLSNGTYGGSLYATWNDYGTGDADILLVYSRDGGINWSEPIRVNNDNTTNDQFFPAISVSPNGWVHLIFYDRRDDPDNVLLSIYYAQSRDGGENFTIQHNLTTAQFNGDYSKGPFIGDYI
ncbi:MAG: exo-alpha-sialidase, partial [Thermoplasmata archaeon]|nr:exo-alpha-sialidase [Thermoplasmata archaeon]